MRIEKDSMGEMQVPNEALYGASTQRAVLNFEVSSLRFSRRFIKAIGIIKRSAALTNQKLSLLEKNISQAIVKACDEVISGELDQHFVVDIFQTGSGTSTNMNANEVIANRAIQLLGGKLGDKNLVHPNDHVNMSQSSNDVIPTAIHLAACLSASEILLPGLESLQRALASKSNEFSDVIKSGRTHLQDATPITLGQEFSGYATQIQFGMERIKRALPSLYELALGGTAVGTGLNTHPEFPGLAIAEIAALTKLPFVETRNHFQAQACADASVEMSGQLKTVAVSLIKIANDIRWLASGPRLGIGEIMLPEIQPGSSIMPAKVNPVVCESVLMVAAHVIGKDTSITVCAQHGNFELNTMLPVIGYDLIQSIELIGNAATNFTKKCVEGISADREKCLENAEKSLATCTSLAPKIGYDQAAAIAKRALKENRTVREVATEMQVLPKEELARVLDLMAMTRPGL